MPDTVPTARETKLLAGSLIAASLSIPAIFLQSSGNNTLHTWGNILSTAIWLYFVFEVAILLRIAPNNLAWAATHKLEVCIVIGASPMLTLMGENEMVFGITPLLIIPRMLKLLKFAKFMKIGKLLKSVKIIKKHEATPEWLDASVLFIGALLTIGLMGMLIDKKSHSIIDGFFYWFKLLTTQFRINTGYLLGTLVVVAFGAVVVLKKKVKVKGKSQSS